MRRSPAFEYFSTKKDEFVGWARKFSLFPYPFVTACCAMEFMAVSSTPYDTDRFGAALPRFSPRQSDLLMVVGTLTHKQAPVLLRVYEQMCEPKWVMAFGACATSGGFYQNYAAVAGIDKIIPVDIYVPGCPPRPETVIDAIMKLQDRIAGSRHPIITRDLLIMAAAILERMQRQLVPAGGEASLSPRHARDRSSFHRSARHRESSQVGVRVSICSWTSRRSTGRSGRRASTSSITSIPLRT